MCFIHFASLYFKTGNVKWNQRKKYEKINLNFCFAEFSSEMRNWVRMRINFKLHNQQLHINETTVYFRRMLNTNGKTTNDYHILNITYNQ